MKQYEINNSYTLLNFDGVINRDIYTAFTDISESYVHNSNTAGCCYIFRENGNAEYFIRF